MAISPISPAETGQGMNIAPLGRPNPVEPVGKPATYAAETPKTPEIGRNLAPADEKAKFGMIELKDSAAGLDTAVAQAEETSIIPKQFASMGADGKLEGKTALTDNMKEVQASTGEAKPGELGSLFEKKSPAEAANNDVTPSFAIETPGDGANENAVNTLANGYNMMAKAASDIGSDRLQSRLRSIYEEAFAGLSKVGVSMKPDGMLNVAFIPGQDSSGALGDFAARLKDLANEVGQNPAAFAQNAKDGMLYGANGGALLQIAAQMSSIGQLFDSFV